MIENILQLHVIDTKLNKMLLNWNKISVLDTHLAGAIEEWEVFNIKQYLQKKRKSAIPKQTTKCKHSF